MIQVDLDARRVTAAIGELVARPSRRRGDGLWQNLRARLGTQVHLRYAERCARAAPATQTEVSVELRRRVDDFDVVLRGRIDGLDTSGDVTRIDEVKSMLEYTDELRARGDQLAYPEYCEQLRMYGLAVADRWPERPLRLRLVLGSVIDGGWHDIDIDVCADATEHLVRRRVRAAIAQARRDRRRARNRRLTADRLRFPYAAPRPVQAELVSALDQVLEYGRPALACAPTGTGKTVAALLPALRAALRADAHVYFATAKTTQQALVARTFEDIATASGDTPRRLVAVTLRAKQRMCPPGDLACHPDLCPYLARFDVRADGCIDDLVEAGGHLDPDRIYRAGTEHTLCPFELSMAVAGHADVVIGDYNYAFDRPTTTPLRTFVVIDEAHNLFDRARAYASPELTAEQVAALPRSMTPLRRALLAAIDDAAADTSDDAPVSLETQRWNELARAAESALLRYVVYKRSHRIVRPRDPVNTTLRTVLSLAALVDAGDPALVPYARTTGGAAVGIVCVDPSTHLAQCHRSVLGTIAISATLEPLAYYRDVLGFAELDPVELQVPSPFPSHNRCVLVVPTIDTRYRERERHLATIAATTAAIVRTRPGNYAAFFPSFALLNAVADRLDVSPEQLLIQRQGMSRTEQRGLLDALRRADRPRLLLAVMGGMFAEGVDLPGEALIGAIVVGPGLPYIGFDRTLMRQHFERHRGDGFAYALLYPGMQRVVQCAGRVIRTMSDRGVVALLGRRFARPPYAACLPRDWHDGDVAALITSEPAARLRAFWASAGASATADSDSCTRSTPPSVCRPGDTADTSRSPKAASSADTGALAR